ncbi:hyaluronidase-like isoform X2 [Portunus trituberculatus]|uniref:hyaluronidase-like isoform X2 n=1 Tax=Portunus trituberculatus TaxID=210409 RepID=UPI001E1D0424|nr:hyaluronidase-like isoform X2 [Portunus trituberculatus]
MPRRRHVMRADTRLFPWWLCACLCALRGVACASEPFHVYWNVPSFLCGKYGTYINVSQFGIVQNAGDAFHGEKVTILYDPGAFPMFDKEGQALRGGIPQNGSLATHIQRFINTLNTIVPLDFKGAGVLDFEKYYPSYTESPAEYRVASRAWVKEKHPDWSPEKVEIHAWESFNSSARDFFQSLLWVARELRPGGLWGYYHYPYCNDWKAFSTTCNPQIKKMNEKLSWMFKSSVALYPSMYVRYYSGYSPRARRQHARLSLLEGLAARRRDNPTAPVIPYMWYRYHDTPDLLYPVDIVNTLGMTRLLGGQGVVVWGGGKDLATKEKCQELKAYAEGQLGPLVRYLAHLPRTKLRRLLASRARLKRGVRAALREVKTRAVDGAGAWCSNRVGGCT